MEAGCGMLQWIDPKMCKRSLQIIPGLLKKINKLEEEGMSDEGAKKNIVYEASCETKEGSRLILAEVLNINAAVYQVRGEMKEAKEVSVKLIAEAQKIKNIMLIIVVVLVYAFFFK